VAGRRKDPPAPDPAKTPGAVSSVVGGGLRRRAGVRYHAARSQV